MVWKEIKERDEDYKMPQISIYITNPLNLWYISVTELKDTSPPLLVLFAASEKNWFLENECGMFCVRKITR